jgi:hypothetical protein
MMVLVGQAQVKSTPAPIPTQITAAKKVFVSNAGTLRNNVTKLSPYDGGPNRSYEEFYAGLKDWGRYELVPSPREADLVLEISFDENTACIGLLLLDPQTHITLWNLNQYVEPALLQKNSDRNFDAAIDVLLGQLKSLVTPASVAQK